jgi:hypothetical protein
MFWMSNLLTDLRVIATLAETGRLYLETLLVPAAICTEICIKRTCIEQSVMQKGIDKDTGEPEMCGTVVFTVTYRSAAMIFKWQTAPLIFSVLTASMR